MTRLWSGATVGQGDTVLVVDPADEYHGLEGRVVGFETGLLSGRDMAVVQLDGRERWDIEAFYLHQIEDPAAVTA